MGYLTFNRGEAMRKKYFTLIAAIVTLNILFTGCIGFLLKSNTKVGEDGTIYRKNVYSGPDIKKFQLPRGPNWKVERSDTLIVVEGNFKNVEQMNPDYLLVMEMPPGNIENLSKFMGTDTLREEDFITTNKVKLAKNYRFVYTDFSYSETFDNKLIIEALKFETVEENSWQDRTAKEIDSLFTAKFIDAFKMYKFIYTLSLPGNIYLSNADSIKDGNGIWNFTLADFNNNYRYFTISGVSRKYNLLNIGALIGIIALLVVLYFKIRK